MANNFIIGKGTKVSIFLLPEGSRDEPTGTTITSQALSTAAAATSIPLTGTLPAGVVIPPGTFLGFVAPTTGKVVVAKVTALADTGDGAITVAALPEAIAASSTVAYPLRLKGRTAANLGRSANDVTRVDFDSDAYSDGATTSIEQTLELPGSYLPTDAGFKTLEYAFEELLEVWVELELPKPSSLYSKGVVYKGVCSVTELPLDIAADGVIEGNVSLKWRGRPAKVEAVPV